jgi:predicted TIM-barrel fold metal-dependent hydrolase
MIRNFIDAHVHLNTISLAKMEKAIEYGVSFLSINTDIPFFISIDDQERVVLELSKKYHGRVKYLTTFDVKDFGTTGWAEKSIIRIKKSMENGAAGVKIWKNIGMDLRDSKGNFVMVDNDALDPVYEYLASNKIPLLGHQGEPRNCWLPLEEMTVDSDQSYFKEHPEYHMYLHPEFPSYEEQIHARDNMLIKHPDLIYVGAHLGSMEWDVNEVAKRLDNFPNMMTDLAERICHLQLVAKTDREKVRNFVLNYQDRIIYGTDVIDDGTYNEVELPARFEDLWMKHWKFFATGEDLEAPEFKGKFRGLELPEEVVMKIFKENAAKVYGFEPAFRKTKI